MLGIKYFGNLEHCCFDNYDVWDFFSQSVTSSMTSCNLREICKVKNRKFSYFLVQRHLFGGGVYLKHELLQCKRCSKYTHLELKLLLNTAINSQCSRKTEHFVC